VDDELHDEISRWRLATGLSTSFLVRVLLIQHFERQKEIGRILVPDLIGLPEAERSRLRYRYPRRPRKVKDE
jgi:hypothetical protein